MDAYNDEKYSKMPGLSDWLARTYSLVQPDMGIASKCKEHVDAVNAVTDFVAADGVVIMSQ